MTFYIFSSLSLSLFFSLLFFSCSLKLTLLLMRFFFKVALYFYFFFLIVCRIPLLSHSEKLLEYLSSFLQFPKSRWPSSVEVSLFSFIFFSLFFFYIFLALCTLYFPAFHTFFLLTSSIFYLPHTFPFNYFCNYFFNFVLKYPS